MRLGVLPRTFLVVRLFFLVPFRNSCLVWVQQFLSCVVYHIKLPCTLQCSSDSTVALVVPRHVQSFVARLCVLSCCVAVLLTVLACMGALAGGFQQHSNVSLLLYSFLVSS